MKDWPTHDYDGGNPMLDSMPETNADLVGRTLTLAGKEWTVEKAAAWSESYVYLTRPSDGEGNEDKKDIILRPAGVVRQHLQLTKEST